VRKTTLIPKKRAENKVSDSKINLSSTFENLVAQVLLIK